MGKNSLLIHISLREQEGNLHGVKQLSEDNLLPKLVKVTLTSAMTF